MTTVALRDCPSKRRGCEAQKSDRLFDLGFFELDVLARDGIVFFEHKFFGLITRILLGDIVVARACRAYEPDLLGDGLSHILLETL
jgi:hypothetical protein